MLTTGEGSKAKSGADCEQTGAEKEKKGAEEAKKRAERDQKSLSGRAKRRCRQAPDHMRCHDWGVST